MIRLRTLFPVALLAILTAALPAEVEGDMAIKAGKIVTFEGVGAQYDGDYYVTSAVHTLKPGSGPGTGYITRISFKRTAVKE